MRNSAGNTIARLYAVLLMFSFASATYSQTIIDWNNPSGGSYTSVLNWTPNNVPDNTSESARFNVASTYDVIFGSGTSTTVSDLLVNSGTVTFAANGAVFAAYNIDDDVIINGGNLRLSNSAAAGDVRLNINDLLQVIGGGSLAAEDGTRVQAGNLNVGNSSTGNGTITVAGAGTMMTVTNTTSATVGSSGSTGTLTFQDGSTGNSVSGAMNVAVSGVSNSKGFLNVLSGSTLQTASLSVGTSSSSTVTGQQAIVTVNGSGSSLTMSGASALTIGSAVNNNVGATVLVGDSGVFDTGTGATNLRGAGLIEVLTGGTFNANGNTAITGGVASISNSSGTVNFNGNLTLDGGKYLESGTATRSFAPNTTTTIQNGGVMTLASSNLAIDNGRTVVLDGAASQLNFTGATKSMSIGGSFSSASDGTLTVSNNAQLTLSHATLRAGGTGSSTATLDVLSGGRLITTGTNTLRVENSESSSSQAIINVDGANSQISMQGGFTGLVLGTVAGTGTTATMNLTNGGHFASNTHGLQVNPLGSVHLQDGGMTLFGDSIVRGGTITTAPGSYGSIGLEAWSEIELRVVEGGSVGLRQQILELASNRIVVDGPGSSFTIDGDTVDWGMLWMRSDVGSADAELVVSNLATASTRSLSLATASFTSGGMARVDVRSGGTLTTDHLGIGRLVYDNGSGINEVDSFAHPAEMNIDGPGSKVTIRSGYQAHVGSSLDDAFIAGQFGTLNLTDGGELDTTAGTLFINRPGIVNIDGGTLRAGAVNYDHRGQVNFNSGTLSLGGDLVVENAQLLGPTVELTANKHLELGGMLDIAPAGTVRVDGGSLAVSDIGGGGTFQFLSGSLTVHGAGGLVIGPSGPLATSSLLLGSGRQLRVANTAFVQGGTTVAIQNGGLLEAGTIDNSGEIVLEGTLAQLNGTLTNRGLVRGNGRVLGLLDNWAGGEVRATSGNRLVFDGGPHANAGKLVLAGGEAEFKQTLVNSASGQITGRGTLVVGGSGLFNEGHIALSSGITDIYSNLTNDTGSAAVGITISGNADVTFWDDVANTSGLFRVSANSSATFFGGFGGAGISGAGDVYFEADITPGFSPGLAAFGGDVHLGPLVNLAIEIAGATKGSQYDALEIAGTAALDGMLDVSLLEGFMPGAGDAFEILTAGSIIGTFADLLLPALPGNLSWAVNYGANSVTLAVAAPGDFNFDGAVDAADYVLWRKADGPEEDYDKWRANFGQPASASSGGASGQLSAVPEPATAMTLLVAAIGLLTTSARRGRI